LPSQEFNAHVPGLWSGIAVLPYLPATANTGVSKRYVHVLSDLLHLSPRMAQMILDGKQPADLTLDDLVEDLPLDWKAQEERFGLSPARAA
jgi:hypothetical protein